MNWRPFRHTDNLFLFGRDTDALSQLLFKILAPYWGLTHVSLQRRRSRLGLTVRNTELYNEDFSDPQRVQVEEKFETCQLPRNMSMFQGTVDLHKNPAGASEGLLNTNNKTIECKKRAKEFACRELCHILSPRDSHTFHNLGFGPMPYWVFWLWVRLRETAVVTVIHFEGGIVFWCQLIDWFVLDTVIPEACLTCSHIGKQYLFRHSSVTYSTKVWCQPL